MRDTIVMYLELYLAYNSPLIAHIYVHVCMCLVQ